MLRRAFVLLAFAITSLSAQGLQLPAPVGYVNDFANVISADKAATIARIIDDVRAKSGGEIVVVTLPDLGGRPIEEVESEHRPRVEGRRQREAGRSGAQHRRRSFSSSRRRSSEDGQGHLPHRDGQWRRRLHHRRDDGPDSRRDGSVLPARGTTAAGSSSRRCVSRSGSRANFSFEIDSSCPGGGSAAGTAHDDAPFRRRNSADRVARSYSSSFCRCWAAVGGDVAAVCRSSCRWVVDAAGGAAAASEEAVGSAAAVGEDSAGSAAAVASAAVDRADRGEGQVLGLRS